MEKVTVEDFSSAHFLECREDGKDRKDAKRTVFQTEL